MKRTSIPFATLVVIMPPCLIGAAALACCSEIAGLSRHTIPGAADPF